MPPAPARVPSPARSRAAEPAPASSARKRPAPGPSPLAAAPPRVKLAIVRATETAGGAPLAPGVKGELERSFKADLSAVRVHTDGNARQVAVTLSARAVTHGTHIFLGPGENQQDLPLMAHEVAHVVQQRGGAVAQPWSGSGGDHFEHEAQRASDAAVRGDTFTVRERTDRPRVQRFGISNILDKLASLANNIPGFRMFTIVLGVNPVNMSSVPRTPANILRAAVELIPGGGIITQALESYGIFEKVGAWVQQQIDALGMVGSAIRAGLMKFIDSIELTDLVPWNLGRLADKALDTLTAPVRRLVDFVVGLAVGILTFIKDAILIPLAKLAEGTRGYDLLKAILGQDPVTGAPVPRTAETLIPGFLKLIGEEETWENMKKSRAIPRAWAWFQGAMGAVIGFVQEVPGLVVSTIKSLTLGDVFPITGVFIKVGKAFGGFLGRFIDWIGTALWNLLEIIFEVVSPGALAYIKKTGAALKSILKNPAPFVGNLIKAAKGGFDAFADNFGAHLKAGLISWLTGALEGVYIPKAFTLGELVKFVLSVLGLTWANIRPKLVKATSETIVKAMETGFKLVVTLVTEGPAAFWEQLKAELANLRDMVVGGITDLIVDLIVKKAIPKIVSMFIPGAGFISLILSIYDTVMVFVNRLKQIIAVVTAFIDSIVAIAAGNIGAAVKRVESILARLLSLAIAFLFGFAGLGKVADKVMGVIKKIRAPIDKALDKLIAWVVNMAKKLFAKVFGKDKAVDPAVQKKWDDGIKSVRGVASRSKDKPKGDIERDLSGIRGSYGFKTLVLKQKDSKLVVHAVMNPEEDVDLLGSDLDPNEFTGESLWIEVGRRVHADEVPVGEGARISQKSLSWNSKVLLDLIDKSMEPEPLKAAARATVASSLMRASKSTDEKEIYRLVNAAARAVNNLYAATIADVPGKALQAHHRPGVSESSPTFPQTRAGRKRASVAKRIKDNVANLTPEEKAIGARPAKERPALIRAYVAQLLEKEMQSKTEKGLGPLDEFDLDVITAEVHLGQIHRR